MRDTAEAAVDAHGAEAPAGAGFTINAPPPETDEEAFARLAKLPLLEYERRRDAEAERLGIKRVSKLDKLVAAARGNAGAEPGQGRPLHIPRPEPWPEPVAGSVLLDGLASFLARHVFLPPGAADALAAWTVHTYCFTRFRHSPRVAFTSPEKRCGKTTALDALNLLVCAPLPTANVTVAAFFRTIELAAPTLLIDEADTFIGNNEDLRGAINAGHKRGGQVTRCVGEDSEPRQFSVFAPTAIAAIGKLGRLGTIEDRSIVVRMQRATRGERPAPLDAKAEPEGGRLARMCARWTADHGADLASAEPTLPPALFNRTADNWRPLFAIAEVAGGGWPARLAEASARLVPDDDDEGRGIRLLADIRAVFDARGDDRIPSVDLVAALTAMEAAPWGEANNGRPITPHKLSAMLKPYGIHPGARRDGAEVFKGYDRADFAEAWRRYLDGDGREGEGKRLHGYKPQETRKNGALDRLQPEGPVTDRESRNSLPEAACNRVTDLHPTASEPSRARLDVPI